MGLASEFFWHEETTSFSLMHLAVVSPRDYEDLGPAPTYPIHPGSGRNGYKGHTGPLRSHWRFRETYDRTLSFEDDELVLVLEHVSSPRAVVHLAFIPSYVRVKANKERHYLVMYESETIDLRRMPVQSNTLYFGIPVDQGLPVLRCTIVVEHLVYVPRAFPRPWWACLVCDGHQVVREGPLEPVN